MKKMKHICLLLAAAVMMPACTDWLDIRPLDRTVHENFWKTQEDVESVVLACYRAMMEGGYMGGVILNGEARSDNTIAGKITADPDLERIMNATILPSNAYVKWGDFYKVINYCNSVIEFAPLAADIDPNYTQGMMKAHVAEARTLRALAYFYLVRIWGDVPYIDFPYSEDTQEFKIPKSSGDSILALMAQDLDANEPDGAERYVLKTRGYGITETSQARINTKGRITKNAVRALLADIYLWLASREGADPGLYQKCIDACDRVWPDILPAEIVDFSMVNQDGWTGAELGLHSNATFETRAFNYLYFWKNDYESIFELQFDREKKNGEVNSFYGTNGAFGTLSAALFVNYDKLWLEKDDNNKPKDLRGRFSYKHPVSDELDDLVQIYKYVVYIYGVSANGNVGAEDVSDEVYFPNWIFYRTPDIYLMKAEALVEQGRLEEALALVNVTYKRSNPSAAADLPFAEYSSQELMRELVLHERQREFLFEGKRWFDLLRFARREGKSTTMLKYLLRKYDANSTSIIQSKLINMDALYLPIHQDELKRNTVLVQNQYYLENVK
ncbi:membrane protein [Bacteroidia bacterium]|nr:membrane protein [Bacteroidia bacterium]